MVQNRVLSAMYVQARAENYPNESGARAALRAWRKSSLPGFLRGVCGKALCEEARFRDGRFKRVGTSERILLF